MYVPAHFAETDQGQLVELMRRHPFATLVTTDAAGLPFASHIPFLVDAQPLRLWAHVARANPQWRDLDREALVIFHGPHAYVSPTWYQALPPASRVPTWNYAAVHAYGRARLLEDDETVGLLERLVDENEAGREPRWRADFGEPARRAMVRGIVGFVFDSPRLEGKLKLGQNRAPIDRERVKEQMAALAHPDGPELAALMEPPSRT